MALSVVLLVLFQHERAFQAIYKRAACVPGNLQESGLRILLKLGVRIPRSSYAQNTPGKQVLLLAHREWQATQTQQWYGGLAYKVSRHP